MRIAITIPDSLYAKLEEDRGAVPRATYIQLLIGQGLVSGHVSAKRGVASPEVKSKVVKDKVVEHDSGKKEEIKSVDTGKKGLPSQDVDGFKTFFKK